MTYLDSKGREVTVETMQVQVPVRGPRIFPRHKPKVADVEVWERVAEVTDDDGRNVTVDLAFQPNMEFYRVKTPKGTKYFYGETAWMDAQRLANDNLPYYKGIYLN